MPQVPVASGDKHPASVFAYMMQHRLHYLFGNYFYFCLIVKLYIVSMASANFGVPKLVFSGKTDV
jgi:hypothetical protein